jgi:hypothetical protein
VGDFFIAHSLSLYQVPTAFQQRLHDTFDGRLRIRWSEVAHEFHIEQKVLPGAVIRPLSIDSPLHDRYVRARDGYVFVMAVKAGTHTYCKSCGFRCHVPALRTGEIICTYCEGVRKQRGREFGGFWPLSDVLLDHLRKIDPNRDGHLNAALDQDATRLRHERTVRRDTLNTVEAGAKEDVHQLFGIQRAFMNDAYRKQTP